MCWHFMSPTNILRSVAPQFVLGQFACITDASANRKQEDRQVLLRSGVLPRANCRPPMICCQGKGSATPCFCSPRRLRKITRSRNRAVISRARSAHVSGFSWVILCARQAAARGHEVVRAFQEKERA